MLSMTCYIDISILSFLGIFRWFSTFCWLTIVLKRCIKMFVHFVCAIICADDGANPWQFMHFEKSEHTQTHPFTHTQTHPNAVIHAGHHKTKLIAKIMDIEACYAFWDENNTHTLRAKEGDRMRESQHHENWIFDRIDKLTANWFYSSQVPNNFHIWNQRQRGVC